MQMACRSRAPEPHMISVIIPYFQRSPGVLRRALASVAAQLDCPLPIHVIVIDDSSPVNATDEIASADLPDSIGMTLIHQANAGPGAARNSGLDAVAKTTRYIAFLDSDDEWSPDHLSRAVLALEAGFDFYFADHFQLDSTVSAFTRGGKLKAGDHRLLPLSKPAIHAYEGDMVDQIIRGNVIGTSTVVYRRLSAAGQRFRIEFTNAGEDYLFWLSLVQAGCRITFSEQIETTYGHGVNVYAGATWGSTEHMLRVHNELKYRKVLMQHFCHSNEQRLFLRDAIQSLRRNFLSDLLHRIKNHKPIPWLLIARYFRNDPQTFWLAPVLIHQIVREQL